MTELQKGTAVFKHRPEDFIVEEVWEDYVCEVSENLKSFEEAKVDFGKLDCADRRDFLTCELEKINVDHFSAINILANGLKNYPHELGYAGTKDKVAWTCQKLSIFNADIERIKTFSHPGMILKNFKWAKHKIKVGDLSGNRFRVVLRDADKDALKILGRVRNSEYLPNFFGEQRFGSLRRDNVKIGKLILERKFKEAVFAYLTGCGEEESEEVRKAKKRLKLEKDIFEARNYFPEQLVVEHKMIDYLSQSKEDWIGALKVIGEKTLLMMVQSVQSQIFNDVLGRASEEGIALHNQSINLLGYNSAPSSGRLGKIEMEVLREHGLELRDFKVVALPTLSLKSSTRKALFRVRDLDVGTDADELFPPSKKIILTFTLDSGTYATTFLDQFFVLR